MSYLDTKVIPPDIYAAGFPWNQRTSETWTTPAFRAPIIAFLKDFANPKDALGRNWVAAIVRVDEHILSGANMNAPLPKTPRYPADVPDPIRIGLASLVFRVRNIQNGHEYEYGIPYLDRLDTTPADVAAGLAAMAASFDAQARRHT